MTRVCLFGDFDPEYPRNRIIREGLQAAGVEVYSCMTHKKGWSRFRDLRRIYRTIPPHDLVLVGYSDSRTMVPFARFITKVPVAWDAFYSRYDAMVKDRALVSRFSLKAWMYWFGDFVSAHLACRVFLDTETHAAYFSQAFFVRRARCVSILVGSDAWPIAVPREAQGVLTIGFYGKYIPLQGVDVIIRAAHLLTDKPNIRFVLLGSGQTYAQMRVLARRLGGTNIEFRDRIPAKEIPSFIASLDIALGIFGTTGKAARVIPNKVYDAIAMGKPVITADTPAVRELLQPGYDVFLVPAGDPEALAAAIEKLASDEALRKELGAHALETYQKYATPKIIGEKLTSALQAARKNDCAQRA